MKNHHVNVKYASKGYPTRMESTLSVTSITNCMC